ncbi:glycosyltransferase family 2 protein [Solitalea longa]|uniref:Glycosyltransferase family 2 protein n=1 Tax=Solitalea longa TaxID=2079460 RepID=A0A2S4ZX19_9SPHI|nr:glycosyltransferase [Solitalea longa]POY34910.1 glycosyltransferase family 2 protein [Solitalea longa]
MPDSNINNEIFYSIIIPLYNREHLIASTIESVLTQTIEEKIEVIVVDDGSIDNSAVVVNGFQDPRLKYIYQKNSGATVARNTGIKAAQGKYIAFLDSDDKFLPDHLSNAKTAIQYNPDCVIYSPIIIDRGNGNQFIKPPRAIQAHEPMSEYLLCYRGFIPTCTLVLPTYMAKKVLYREGLPYGQDTDFAIRLFNEGAKFQMLPAPGAICLDIYDLNRVSSKYTSESREAWLRSVRHIITDRAYKGDLGWVVAKGFAKKGRIDKSLYLYLQALFKKCYNPNLAFVIFLQIFLPDRLFRIFADTYINIKKTRKSINMFLGISR